MKFLANQSLFRLVSVILTATVLLQACAEAVVVGTATGARVAHDRRTPGTVIDDQIIEFKASSIIRKNKALKKQVHVSITSYNLIVLLSGEARTGALKSQVEELIRKLPKVRRIHNEIVIGEPSTRGSRLRDSWITTKAKTSLFKIKKKNFNPTRVKVVTENKTVFLLGLVRPDEGDAAVERVRNISGVEKVVKVFEYIKPRKPKDDNNSN